MRISDWSSDVCSSDLDAPLRPPRLDAEQRESVDHPAFERRDIGAHVAPAPRQVELDIADALARPVIGIAPAAPGVVNRELRVEQLGGIGARSGGIERRMLNQPDAKIGRASWREGVWRAV